MLYAIFYSYLNTSCLNKTIVLLEHVYTDRRIVEAMAKILFKKFKIERIEFGLSCITPLYLTGRFSGLVVLAGSSAVEIMPVYESINLIRYRLSTVHLLQKHPSRGARYAKTDQR